MANTIPCKLNGMYLKESDDNNYRTGVLAWKEYEFKDSDYNVTTPVPDYIFPKDPLELNEHPLIVFLDTILMKFMSFIDYLDKKLGDNKNERIQD